MEQSNIALFKVVESISKLTLVNFISCCIEKDLTPLIISGDLMGSEQEIEILNNAWINILSQYAEARNDETQKERKELVFRIKQLELRASVIGLILGSLEMFFFDKLIEIVKEYDEEFCQFEFSHESYLNDIAMIKNIELNNKIEHDELELQLQEIEKEETKKLGGELGLSKTKLEQVFYDYVISYNEVFKTSHSVDRLNTLEYARMCFRHDEYVKNINNNTNSN